MKDLLIPFGHFLPPEMAHRAAIKALKFGLFKSTQEMSSASLQQQLHGLTFLNPLGVAAGFDKNAEVPTEVIEAGFGFAEVGTITPLPQPGNDKPRVFRLKKHQAVINRFGFNSEGHDVAYERLTAISKHIGPIGINIGANKNTDDFVADYEKGIIRFTEIADYFAVNISSPNTPGLRNLQYGDSLKTLINRIDATRSKCSELFQKLPPVFLKIAPDLDEGMMDTIATAFENSNFQGLIISNTTLARKGVENHAHAGEAGGLSGRPLAHASTVVLAKMRQRIGAKTTIIGVGGVHDAKTALDKFEAGANLVQLYSALTYEGFGLANSINAQLKVHLLENNFANINEVTGKKTDEWAKKAI